MRRLLIPLGVSIALHFGLLALRPAPPPPPELVRDPIELDFVSEVLPKPSPLAEVAKPAPEAHRAAKVALARPPEPKPVAQPPAADVPKADLPPPQVLTWTPRLDGPPPPAETHGHLIHNRPEELPDPAVVAEYQREEAHAKVQGFLEGGFASQRVDNGLVSTWFTDLHHQLAKSIEHPPMFVEPFSLDHLDRWAKQHSELDLTAFKAAAQNYGATGTPYLTPEAMPAGELPSSLQRELDRGSTQAREFAQTLQVGARLRDFGNGKMGAELTAVVELRQGPSGALLSSLLLQSSGNKLFDSWVMGQAIEGVGLTPPPPDAGLGIHPDGMRSVWAFAGKVVYKRSMQELKLKDDWWYLAAALATSALTGNFEETTGKVEYIDLRHPSFECRVSLLQVY